MIGTKQYKAQLEITLTTETGDVFKRPIELVVEADSKEAAEAMLAKKQCNGRDYPYCADRNTSCGPRYRPQRLRSHMRYLSEKINAVVVLVVVLMRWRLPERGSLQLRSAPGVLPRVGAGVRRVRRRADG